jgi:RND family efflux transporter MFP subunit
VQAAGSEATSGFDGVVEAVRQTVVAAQVAGAVTALDVKAGDTVKAGQVLARIDARAAEQNASASAAQVQSAQALLDVASKDFERQKQLFQKEYISQAALERAESQFKATQAQAAAMLAQAGAARTQSGFYVVRAPFAGVVAEVPVALGDMAMPGRALLTLYEPGALRVTVSVPQSAVVPPVQGVKVELPGLPVEQRRFTATQVQVLPTVDAATHTVQLRIGLPASLAGAAPGMFARVWLPSAQVASGRLYVPAATIVRRAEMTGVYVVDAQGAPVLRQVRLGRTGGDTVEVLSGVSAGDRVALDPQAAARSTAEAPK